MVTSVGVRAAVRAAVIAYGAAASLPALALGLGEIEMQSFLNEPLRAEVALLDTRELTEDDIRVRLAGVDDFDRLGVERSYFLTSIDFSIEIDESSGTGVIRLSTDDAVLEPFIDVIIEARWPSGRVLREYTVLVDPPAFRQDVVTVSAAERVSSAANLEKPAVAQPRREAGMEREQSGGVALRESSLPPGEMPERAFSAETAEQPRAGNRYMVRRDETLWQIASQGKPEGITVQQAMLDIQRLNPEAFINGNINQIKAGYIIYLPAAGEVSSDDLARALEEVREQNQQWREGRSAPGVTAAATLRVSADTSTRAASARDDDASRSGDTAASSADAAMDGGAVAAAGDASGEDRAPAGTSAASAELAAQLEAMSTRLDTLEQIVSLKDQQIATLEQALREAREAAAAAPPAVVTPAPVTPTPSTATSPAAPAADSSGGIPWLPIGGGLLALLAGGFLVMRRRAKNDDSEFVAAGGAQARAAEDDVFEGVRLKKEDFPAEPEAPATPGASIDPPTAAEADEMADAALADAAAASGLDALSRGGSRGYGERKHDDYIDEGAAGDALAEADIYIAYGRYLQAIELLETAIRNDPSNGAYRVKLIELYVDMGEDDKASEQLDELRATGAADAVARGEALLGAASVDGAGSADSLDLDSDASGDDVLDWSDSQDQPETSGVTDNFADSEIEAGLPELDLEDEPLTEMEPPSEVAPEPDREPVVAETASALDEVESLELSLEDAADSEPVQPLADAEEGEQIDFAHLEIEEDSAPEAPGDELDFAADEDELDLSEALDADGDAEESDRSGEEEDLLYADDADQMATKLDLARAYIDMGDSEGAKGILEEVLAKGTDEQQQEADELLTRIS